MSLPKIVSREEWLTARKELLTKEKAATHARDALSAERRNLPMVRIVKEYVFEGIKGPARLPELFEGRRQLIIHHFMFDPSWDDGCSSCTSFENDVGYLPHLHEKDTSYAIVSRAPLTKIEAYKRRMGWTAPWYSSFGSDFNYDFHVTMDETVAPVEYNYRDKAEHEQAGTVAYTSGEQPGLSVFLREGEIIFHTYSAYARGLDHLTSFPNFMDLTPLGRQEPIDLAVITKDS
jgi:predicted dithiol-disulfide oxidoreductase (DUF899 family)